MREPKAKPRLVMMPDGNLGAEMDMTDIGHFVVTPERVRDVTLSDFIISGPGIIKTFLPTTRELGVILDMMKHAVNSGQMIDFGYWPNDMIREVGTRAGTLYCQDALGMPFSTPWVFLHSWNDPKLPFTMFAKSHAETLQGIGYKEEEIHTCAYLVNPFPLSAENPKQLCIDFEAMCFESLLIPKTNGIRCLGIGDRATLHSAESRKAGFYACNVVPYALRWPFIDNPEFQRIASNRNNDDIYHSACGNVIDPVMVALMLLNTRNVRQTTVSYEKLNKNRSKSNKPPIPPYRKVDSASYVTAIMNRFAPQKRGPGIGTHASPMMHIRQGHWRHFKTGERSFIRDTLVNASQEMREQFIAGRSHYTFKGIDDE
jgi:hypothetical protein